jgi:hypothetical protein
MSLSKSVHVFSLLLLVIAAAACANREATFVAAPQNADKGSVVYIYRPSSSTNFMMSPAIVVDDNEKFRLASGDYRYIYLNSGNHSIGLNPTDQYLTDAAISINIEAGKSYYLRVSTSLKFEPEQMNTRKFWIDPVAESEALPEIAKTDYSGPRLEQPPASQNGAVKTGEGFSVDKTQDPFAGKN